MRVYKIKGMGLITASTPSELAEKLNSGSLFGYRKNLELFMKETSKACRIQNGSKIRFANPEIFVEDLIANKFVVEVENA